MEGDDSLWTLKSPMKKQKIQEESDDKDDKKQGFGEDLE